MYRRTLLEEVEEALADTPVVFIAGPRQSGKSTLAQFICERSGRKAEFYTLDDDIHLSTARKDPLSFLDRPHSLVVVDEIQYLPSLFRTIKLLVDRDRRPGRFLLTGSANPLLLPTACESLAGRMQILTLYPLAQSELSRREGLLIPQLFDESYDMRSMPTEPLVGDLAKSIVQGGFPEAIDKKGKRREQWFESYLSSLILRDIAQLANIERLRDLTFLFRLLAARASGILNINELSRTSGIPHTSLRRYLHLLETIYLVHLLPPWFVNRSKRYIKSPKLGFVDTGLLCHLLQLNEKGLQSHPFYWGAALENYVVSEIRKMAAWNPFLVLLYHFRLASGQKVDLVLEGREGRVVGIEVKSTRVLRAEDFRGLDALADVAGKRFVRGIVFYRGTEILPFGPKHYAVPLCF